MVKRTWIVLVDWIERNVISVERQKQEFAVCRHREETKNLNIK